MVRLCALVLVALLACGCGLLAPSSPRELGERFADAIEGLSSATPDSFLTPDAQAYLQGGAPASRQVFHDYLERLRIGGQVYHRMSRVYLTPNGAGWLVGITHPGTGTIPSLWAEASIVDGRVTRVSFNFTVETLQSLHQLPDSYSASMAGWGLPLPESWADGTNAMLAAAERYDAAHDAGPRLPPLPVDALVGLGALAALAAVLRRVVWPGSAPHQTVVARTRHGALLESVRARRAQVGTGTSIPV